MFTIDSTVTVSRISCGDPPGSLTTEPIGWSEGAVVTQGEQIQFLATTILLPLHRTVGVWACTVLGMIYPLLLAAGSAPGTPVRAMQLLYVVTAAAGGITALWTLPFTRGATIRLVATHKGGLRGAGLADRDAGLSLHQSQYDKTVFSLIFPVSELQIGEYAVKA
jgi:hypothetical protein